jgi:hypothetical protein
MRVHISFAILILMLASSLVFSQSGKLIAITAEKEVPIQNGDVAAARTTALALAARDAVERGYGTYLSLQELPAGRQILAKAAAGLRYVILAEEKRGNKYWVKIQANVMIPKEYISEESAEREELGEPMRNFVQKYPQGEINWGEGYIVAYGKGTIPSGKDPAGEEKAARAAEVEAKAHLLEILQDVPVDDRTKIGQDQRLSFTMEGFVQGAQVIAQSKSGDVVNVTVQAPIRGVKGLAMTILGYYTPEPPKEETKAAPPLKTVPLPAAAKEPEKFTGIVIDARAVAATPAVFPKVKDSKKREIYTVKQVNKEDLQKRGMASFAMVARDVNISRIFPHAAVFKVAYSPANPEPFQAKKRQGEYPYVASVLESNGEIKSELIIGEEDAAAIAAIDEKTNALKQCKVVIVVSGS